MISRVMGKYDTNKASIASFPHFVRVGVLLSWSLFIPAVIAVFKYVYCFQYAWVQRVAVYSHRYQTRKHLRYLTAEQLDDVGLSVEQADSEMNKHFWKN